MLTVTANRLAGLAKWLSIGVLVMILLSAHQQRAWAGSQLEAGGQVTLFQFDLVQSGGPPIHETAWLQGGLLQIAMSPGFSFRLGGLFGGGPLRLLQFDTEILARYNLGQVDLYLGGGVGLLQLSSASVFAFQLPLFGVIGLQTEKHFNLNGFVDFRAIVPMRLGGSLLQISSTRPPFQFSFGLIYRL